MIGILATVVLAQLTVSPNLGLFEVKNMIQRQTGGVNSWDYTTNSIYASGNGGMRGFRNVNPASQAKSKTKSADKKIECGENCLCTKLSEQEIKDILDLIKQQKERQAAMEKFRQRNPNAQFGGPSNFRGRGQQNARPSQNQQRPD
jgi:hypothetical protein